MMQSDAFWLTNLPIDALTGQYLPHQHLPI
jgi:hypothetical protein